MGASLSIDQVLAELERQVAHHREREEHHRQQESFHQERRAFHATELQTADERLAAFRAAAASAGELMERQRAAAAAPSAPPSPPEPIPTGRRRPVGRLVVRAVESFPPEAAFDASDVAQVVNQRYGASLRQRFDGRAVSVTLRRLVADGRLHLVQKGTSHHLARYSRTAPPTSPR